MIAIKKMFTLKFMIIFQILQSSCQGLIFIWNDHLWTLIHDVRERFKDLVKSVLCFFSWNHKSKRDQPFCITDSHETSNSPVSSTLMLFLNQIESVIKANPISKLLKILFHFWGDDNHQCWQFVHFFIKRICLDFIMFFIQEIRKFSKRCLLISCFSKVIIKFRLTDWKLMSY